MKFLQTQGVKAKPWQIFPSLKPIYNPPKKEGFNVSSFKGSSLLQKMMKAKGGDKLDFKFKD